MSSGRLTLVAGPIGNLGDLSPRAIQALGDADIWYVEDTRVSGKLQSHLGLKKPMSVLNEHARPDQITRFADQIEQGQSAIVLSDGGAPGVSDPGALLCDECHQRDIPIDVIPGPSAPIAALMGSGFFAQRFAFLGFPPRKAGAIKKLLDPFAESPLTLVLFESPFRVHALLKVCSEALPGRRYAVCRELTKMHQQIARFQFPYIPTEKEVPAKGEFTLVIEGLRRGGNLDDPED